MPSTRDPHQKQMESKPQHYLLCKPHRKTPTASGENTMQIGQKKASAARMREPRTAGEALFFLLDQVKWMKAEPEQLPALMQSYLDTMMGMQLENIEFEQIVDYSLLYMLQLMEDNLVKSKITIPIKFTKLKDTMKQTLIDRWEKHGRIPVQYFYLVEQKLYLPTTQGDELKKKKESC